MAREAKRDKGKPSFSLWEVETCIRAADLLLWPHIKKAKETGRGKKRNSTEMTPSWPSLNNQLSIMPVPYLLLLPHTKKAKEM